MNGFPTSITFDKFASMKTFFLWLRLKPLRPPPKEPKQTVWSVVNRRIYSRVPKPKSTF